MRKKKGEATQGERRPESQGAKEVGQLNKIKIGEIECPLLDKQEKQRVERQLQSKDDERRMTTHRFNGDRRKQQPRQEISQVRVRGNRQFITRQDGWTEVHRKEQVKTTRFGGRGAFNRRSFRSKTFNYHLKCFRCLSTSHKIRECKEQIRCIYCFKLGHRRKNCWSINTEGFNRLKQSEYNLKFLPKKNQRIEKKKNTQKTYESNQPRIVKTPQNKERRIVVYQEPMEEANAMALQAAEIMNLRPIMREVYFHRRSNLAMHLEFLNRCAYVCLVEGDDRETLKSEIQGLLIFAFGGGPENYTLYHAGDPFTYILICTDQQLRDQVVGVGEPYQLDDEILLLFEEWIPAAASPIDDLDKRCYIRLAWPHHNLWSRNDLSRMCSGFGLLRSTRVFFPPNGEFQGVRVVVDCDDPTNIPTQLRVHIEHRSKLVHVHLLGWRNINNPNFDLNGMEEDNGEGEVDPHGRPSRGQTITQVEQNGFHLPGLQTPIAEATATVHTIHTILYKTQTLCSWEIHSNADGYGWIRSGRWEIHYAVGKLHLIRAFHKTGDIEVNTVDRDDNLPD